MSDSRKGADLFLFQLMLLLCALWGSQQVAIKLAAADVVPLLQVALRSGIAALLVGLVLIWQRSWRGWLGCTWQGGLLAGTLFGLEFFFIAQGLRYTSASHMAVFLYTAPIFSALGLHLSLPSERLRRAQWLGIGLCFAGVVTAFGVGANWSTLDRSVLLGDLLGLLAGLSWGMSTVVVRNSRLSDAPPALTLFYQLVAAFVLLLSCYLLFTDIEAPRWTPTAIASVLFQGVVVSFFSYLAWFWLLRRYLASNMAVFAFMTPMYGVTFGVLVLDEPLTLSFVIGSVLVLLGIGLVSGEGWLRRRWQGWSAAAER